MKDCENDTKYKAFILALARKCFIFGISALYNLLL